MIESIYCEEDLQLHDSVPEDYVQQGDLGVRSQDITIHIPEDLARTFLEPSLSVQHNPSV